MNILFNKSGGMVVGNSDEYIDLTKHPILWKIIYFAKASWILLVHLGPFVIFFWFVFTIISNMNT